LASFMPNMRLPNLPYTCIETPNELHYCNLPSMIARKIRKYTKYSTYTAEVITQTRPVLHLHPSADPSCLGTLAGILHPRIPRPTGSCTYTTFQVVCIVSYIALSLHLLHACCTEVLATQGSPNLSRAAAHSRDLPPLCVPLLRL
jgi:hypothetical protein